MKIETVKEARGRNVYFLLFLVVVTAIFAAPLSSLFWFSYGDETFSCKLTGVPVFREGHLSLKAV